MRIGTPEARQRQAELIRSWKPWTHSTGARTPEGKAIVSQNRQRSQDRARAEIEQVRQEFQAKVRAFNRIKGADNYRAYGEHVNSVLAWLCIAW